MQEIAQVQLMTKLWRGNNRWASSWQFFNELIRSRSRQMEMIWEGEEVNRCSESTATVIGG